jgi:glycosyltransferase involved in cell wall biosynthesis
MTRILFVTFTAAYGGMERYLMHLLSHIEPSKAETILLNWGVDCYTERVTQRKGALTIQAEPNRRGFLSLLSFFRRTAPDVIVFVKGEPLVFHWSAYLAAKLSRAQRVYAIEQFVPEPTPTRNRRGGRLVTWLRDRVGCRARFLLRMRLQSLLCDTTICGADIVREKLVNDCQYPAAKTIAVPNGVDLKYYSRQDERSRDLRAELGIEDDESVVLCVSRLVKRKGIDVLLEALSRLRTEPIAWKCIIVGTGPLETELQLQAKTFGLRASVLFVGHKEDIRPYLQLADVFALPSYNDCLPGSLLEAMAFGLPCIAGKIDGKSELIADGRNGILVTPGSVDELTNAITLLLTNRRERDRIASNARRRAEELDLDVTMRTTIRILTERPAVAH